jgi:hypothetical protein
MEQDTLLEEGEIIIIKVRKHYMVYVEDFLLHSIGIIIFILSGIYLATHGVLGSLGDEMTQGGLMVLLGFVLIFWTSFFYAWTRNYFDLWYITDKHIIAINQKDMFEREEAFMELGRIQDVMCDKNGFLATFFGYGTLRVQSAGTEPEFSIAMVSDVDATLHTLMGLRDKAQGKIVGSVSIV